MRSWVGSLIIFRRRFGRDLVFAIQPAPQIYDLAAIAAERKMWVRMRFIHS